jgi:DNA-binding LytR/AlgR family response regulator
MNKESSLFVRLMNREIKILAGITIGVFLFILFFQPFPLEKFDFNNGLLFITGFAGIVFIFMFLTRIIIPLIIRRNDREGDETTMNSYLEGLILLVLSSVAFAFYLRYVGSVHTTFFIVFKEVLICFGPPVVLKIYDVIKGLRNQNESLVSERKAIQKQIEKYEEENLNKTVEFISDTSSENLSLLIAEVVFIQSADNYVEIAYMEGDNLKKSLIRNTLKNIELQIKPYSNFIRCHRTCIVNMRYIEKLNQNYGSHTLTIRGYPEKIPVSRQYLLKLKEAL